MKKLLYLLFLIISFSQETYSQSLEEYQQLAVEGNPGLMAQYKEFEAALERVPQVNAFEDPTFSVATLGRMTQTRTGQQMAIFNLNQMFPWFGTLKAQGDVSALMAEAKYQAFLDARNQLYYQVSAAYYPLYELQKWIEIEQENIQLLESFKSIADVKFRNGKGAMVDVLRVDIMLKDAKTNLSILNQKKRPLETRFNKLLNRDPSDSIMISDTLTLPLLAMDYRRDSLSENPILTGLDLRIKASEASGRVAVKQSMPKLGVGFQYIIVAQRTDASVPQNGQDAFMPMVSMSLPIFRGKYKAAQNEAELMQESFSLQKAEVANQLTSAYEMAWFEIQQQLELIQLYEQQITESQQSLNLLFSAFSNSGEAFEDLLSMQQQVLKYQKMGATALVEYHIAFAELDYLTAKNN